MTNPAPPHPPASPATATPVAATSFQNFANEPWVRDFLFPFGLAAVLLFVCFLINQGLKNPQTIPALLLYLLIFLTVVVGGGFFILRQRYRLAYGIVELIVGIVLAVLETGPAVGVVFPLSQNFSLLKEIAAVYVIVRAIENIGKGLKQIADRPPVIGQPTGRYEAWGRDMRVLWVDWLGPEA